VFCPTCKSLLLRRSVRGRIVSYCPQCDGVDAPDKPLAWFAGDPVATRAQDGGRAAKGGGAAPARPRARAMAPPAPRARDAVARAPQELALSPDTDLFPFGTVRDGQREFMADVARAAAERRHLLAHAPTGLGKTVSTLAPLVEYALRNKKRVFFLTSKQSQHKIAIDTLKAIREKARVPLVVSDVIGKQDMCPRAEARDMFPKRFSEFCRREQVSHQCDYWETANGQALRLLRQKVNHVEELVIAATDCGVCPHQAAVDLAAEAHVVVCDYNYLFSDMRVGVQERLQLQLEDVLLVVDEAHNLPDRIRDHLTLSLNEYVLDDAMDEVNDLDRPSLGRLIEALRLVLSGLAEIEPHRDPADDRPASASERYVAREELIEAVDRELAKARSLTRTDYAGLLEAVENAVADFAEKFKADSRGLAELYEFLSNWKIERRGVARILTREPSASLAYKILDPSVLAKPVFDAVHASVVMSGTLHPMEMMRDVLGLDRERAVLREYASPFPRENRPVLVDASVTTVYKERTPQMFREIGERLASVALATPGNVAAFFPSYALMDEIKPFVEAGLRGRKDLIVEERGLDKSQKEGLVHQMRGESQNALLLGVQGGSLSEGYDYEGNLLKGVVIVGLPFAAPSLEVESLIAYYERKFGAGKGRPYAYVYPTFHRVLQAAGRCIRSSADRGVIVLLDKRFAWSTYRSSYPRDFEARESRDVVADVRAFWSRR
jgi:DNA excision repair protein ERCC-2